MEKLKTCRNGLHQYASGIRRCPECKLISTRKAAKVFYNKNKLACNEKSKMYKKKNPNKTKALRRKNYLSKVEENKEYSRKHRSENKVKCKKQKKEWEAANYNKVRHYSNKSAKKYNLANPEKRLARTRARQAAKLKRTPMWLTKQHFEQIEFFYACAKDMEKMFGTKYHVDHIVPIQGKNVSGLHVPWNLQVIRAEENLKKSNKLEQASA